ncbi:hypothetical protein DPMN_184889 [Dreissena polymorpha]|uniref:Uncharacterized protein n=1 Tax=Dreissena polymorpha TaxID=45954 RepID=A0A9D4I7T9_DREPO|nr:hypothetical protein DPMN_184889 [Dreissena polymorpha]
MHDSTSYSTNDNQTQTAENTPLPHTETQPTTITNADTSVTYNTDTTTSINGTKPPTEDEANLIRKRRQLDKTNSVVFGVWNNKGCQCEPNGVETHKLGKALIST